MIKRRKKSLGRSLGSGLWRWPGWLAPACAAIIASLLVTPFARGQEASESPFARNDVDRAIERAIGYLVSQQRDDGSIHDRNRNETAMTALAIMALAAVGHQPSDATTEGQVMRRAVDFVLQEDRQDDQGYFGRRDNSRMYGHGIITLMLTEMLGMGYDQRQDVAIRKKLEAAIDMILASQKQSKPAVHRGGWRYQPDARDSDLSVTIWQLMALRSAKNDGLQVPSSAIDEAIDYLRRSYTSAIRADGIPVKDTAGFSYQARQNNPTFTMTAAGLLALQVCGQYDSPLVAGARQWLQEHPPKWRERFVLYGTYYYAQAMQGDESEQAAESRRLVETMLLEQQQPDGSWQGPGEENQQGQVYGTAMAVLSLSVKYHYLPIYQR